MKGESELRNQGKQCCKLLRSFCSVRVMRHMQGCCRIRLYTVNLRVGPYRSIYIPNEDTRHCHLQIYHSLDIRLQQHLIDLHSRGASSFDFLPVGENDILTYVSRQPSQSGYQGGKANSKTCSPPNHSSAPSQAFCHSSATPPPRSRCPLNRPMTAKISSPEQT